MVKSLIAALIMSVPTAAMAASGFSVSGYGEGGMDSPLGIVLKTSDGDGVPYCFSSRDPGAVSGIYSLVLADSLTLGRKVYWNTGAPPAGHFPGDCGGVSVYVWK